MEGYEIQNLASPSDGGSIVDHAGGAGVMYSGFPLGELDRYAKPVATPLSRAMDDEHQDEDGDDELPMSYYGPLHEMERIDDTADVHEFIARLRLLL